MTLSPEPSIMKNDDLWQWQNWQGLPYLTCRLLSNWSHGFFTRQFMAQMPRDLAPILNPAAAVYHAKQVHGPTVLVTKTLENQAQRLEGNLVEGDGIVTTGAQESVWVCSADCVPVLIADRKTGQVSAVHAGWRGTAARIVPKSIELFLSQGSQLENLTVVMGPAIAGEVYQVENTVAAQVGSTIVPSDVKLDTANLLEMLYKLAESPILVDSVPDRVRLDVRRVNAWQLGQMGLSAEQVAIAPYCTYQNPDLFFSYRRNRVKQVQWSGIVSN